MLDRIIAGAADDAVAPSTMTAAIVPASRHALPWVLAGVAAAAAMVALAVSVTHFREVPPPVAERMRFEFPFPEDMRPAQRSVPSLSPDGRHLAFIAKAADGKNRLWIRTLDGEAKPREGTEGAWGSPFWSADSRMVVYQDDRLASAPKLRKIEAFEGPSQVICPFPRLQLWGGLGTANGEIIFGTCCGTGARTAGLFRVAASGGGVAAPLTTILEGERPYGYPVLLPDPKHFLWSRGDGVSVGSLDAAPEQQASAKMLPDRTNVVYVPSGVPGRGFVLFVREATLYAQPFDEGRLKLAGDPQPVAQHVSVADPDLFWLFSAAGNGVLIYQQDGFLQHRPRLWIDRRGQALRPAGEPGFFGGVKLSPSGRQAAYGRREGQHEDLWLTDIERRSDARFTTNAARNWNARWSPDASHITYSSTRGGSIDLYLKAVAAAGGEALILKNGTPLDWSADGKFVLFDRDGDL